MPRVRPLTHAEREMRADEAAVAKASNEFLELLGAERGRRDMTRDAFSDYIGVTRATYCNWRRGGIGGMNVKTFIRICRMMGASVQIAVPNKSPR